MIDLPWLQSMAPALLAADRVVIVHGMQAEIVRGMAAAVFGVRTSARVVVVKPHTPEYGTVHAKAMLTFCGTAGCRMLIHTANDIAQDWMQRCQGGWQRDFPQKTGSDVGRGDSVACDFEKMLVHYLSAVGTAGGEAGGVMESLVIPEVRKYDFSGAGCALVPSVPGRHGHREASPASRNRYGLWRLRNILEQEEIDDSASAAVVSCRVRHGGRCYCRRVAGVREVEAMQAGKVGKQVCTYAEPHCLRKGKSKYHLAGLGYWPEMYVSKRYWA